MGEDLASAPPDPRLMTLATESMLQTMQGARSAIEDDQGVSNAERSADATTGAPSQPAVPARSRRRDRELQAELSTIERLQRLVHDILVEFEHLDVESIGSGVDGALDRLGRFLEVDRCSLYETGDGWIRNTHGWCADGLEMAADPLTSVAIEDLEPWFEAFDRDEEVVIDRVAGPRHDRTDDPDRLATLGIRSLLAVPLRAQHGTHGFLGFQSVGSPRSYSPIEVGMLRSLAGAITSAVIRQRSHRERRRAEARLSALTRHARDHALLMDEAGHVSYASESWSSIDLSPGQLLGHRWMDRLGENARTGLVLMIDRIVTREPGTVRSETLDIEVTTDGGQALWLEVAVHDQRDDPEIDALVLHGRDVTDRKLAEEERVIASFTDPVTGLGNRSYLEAKLAESLSTAAGQGRQVALLFLDLDRFKLINDSHGHTIGDLVLARVGRRLSGLVRGGDLVARFGGDEFVVLVNDVESMPALEAIADRIRLALSEPIELDTMTLRLSVSVGIAAADDSSAESASLLRDADIAMYRAKDRGRNRLATFDHEARREVSRRNDILQRLPDAVEAGLIVPHLQPIVELTNGSIIGAEALARWDDPIIGPVAPDEFISVAEETGLIVPLGLSMLEHSLQAASTWPTRYTISVNLSPGQLVEPTLAAQVATLLDRYAFDPTRLCLEVTESSLMANLDRGVELLLRLRSLGVTLAMDDFGTGFSSLSMLRRLPVDILKIDRAFVSGHRGDTGGDARLVRAVIGLAEEFGMMTLAEGIETDAQRLELRRQGCRRGQGYLFGKAVPPDRFAASIGVEQPRSA